MNGGKVVLLLDMMFKDVEIEETNSDTYSFWGVTVITQGRL